jgi:hypothetical protein
VVAPIDDNGPDSECCTHSRTDAQTYRPADEPADLLDRFAAWPAPDVGRAWLDSSRA